MHAGVPAAISCCFGAFYVHLNASRSSKVSVVAKFSPAVLTEHAGAATALKEVRERDSGRRAAHARLVTVVRRVVRGGRAVCVSAT